MNRKVEIAIKILLTVVLLAAAGSLALLIIKTLVDFALAAIFWLFGVAFSA